MKKIIFFAMLLSLFSCKKSGDTIKSGTLTVLHHFDLMDGAFPTGALVISGNTLYGMTYTGGATGGGVIFSVKTDGSGYIDMHDFRGSDGQSPQGDLTLSGNTLYGLTSAGGTNASGVLFSINTDGSGYQVLYNFGNSDSGQNGAQPNGSLVISGTLLYGMTQGGVNGTGNIFSFNTVGNQYTDLFDFPDDISGPIGSPIISGSMLYGMAYSDNGIIFSFKTNGNVFNRMYSFTANDPTDHPIPVGSLALAGTTLYGMTNAGGAHFSGNIFSIGTNGNGYTDIYDFNSSGPEGPDCGLIVSGNTLYGTTPGGANIGGNIFSVSTNGSNFNSLYAFYVSVGVNAQTVLLSNGFLYGMATDGGKYNHGTIYSYKL